MLFLLFIHCTISGVVPLPNRAKHGIEDFQQQAKVGAFNFDGFTFQKEINTNQNEIFMDYWGAWELTDRPRNMVLLVNDFQEEYRPFTEPCIPQAAKLIEAFRQAGLPIFWSTWKRFGPDDGHYNTMDRFYGPVGWNTGYSALYLSDQEHGFDVIAELAPKTDEERKRVMHKIYSLSMFNEHPKEWLVPNGQGTLNEELTKLGVDTVVLTGSWTDDCVLADAFAAFALQYDVAVISDAVSTASKNHYAALSIIAGSVGKVYDTNKFLEYMYADNKVVKAEVEEAAAQTLTSQAFVQPTNSPASSPHFLLELMFCSLIAFALGWFARGDASKSEVMKYLKAKSYGSC